MAAWLTYLKERFPLPVYVPLVGGFCASGALLGGGRLAALPLAVSFIGLMLFFALLRLMDELKDYGKDQIAHPDRPLPRGLLSTAQVEHTIRLGAVAMLAWGLCAAVLTHTSAGDAYLLVTAYLWLMYREFYCGPWLEQRPLLYALTHQLILLPICYFCVLVFQPDLLTDPLPLYFSLCSLGAFLVYEVCRKLDPDAHPVLRTYLSVYGRSGTFIIVLLATLVAGAGAWALDLHRVLLPVEAVLLLSLTVLWLRPAAYKIPEGLAGLSLLVHLWAIPAKSAWPAL
jgi:4-hydroxybenzoate polyprenyltransferase